MRRRGWMYARDWTGTVTVRGRDVSDRCVAVIVDGERPVAVALMDRPFTLNRVLDRPARYVLAGEITCHLRRRPS